MSTFIVGHLNNDTDSVVSAVALSYLEKQLGKDYEPAIASPINRETEFVLKKFGTKKPEMIPNSKKRVILVDHNEPSQISPNVQIDEIQCVIDHHKLGGLSTPTPISVRVREFGSTSTIIFNILKSKNVQTTNEIAGILSAGIISDTLNLTSPTTTKEDKEALSELTKITKIDSNQLANEMFRAKSDITGMKIEDIINSDYKTFDMAGKTVGIGVWETVMPQVILEKKAEMLEKLKEKKMKENLALLFFAVVDILKNESQMFIIGDDESGAIKKAYDP